MIQALAMRSGMLGYCRYFAKAQLKKVPLLGWGLMAMGMPLVTRNCESLPSIWSTGNASLRVSPLDGGGGAAAVRESMCS